MTERISEMAERVPTLVVHSGEESSWLRTAVNSFEEHMVPTLWKGVVEESGLYFMEVWIVYPCSPDERGVRRGDILGVFIHDEAAQEAQLSYPGDYNKRERVLAFVTSFPNVYVISGNTIASVEGPFRLGTDLVTGLPVDVAKALRKLDPQEQELLREHFTKTS